MPLLTTKAITKRYPGVIALDALDLELQPGIIGLVGANGAGKSTLIRILLGLIEPTSGSATLLGYDVARQGVELRQFVGYMPEHDCLPTDVSATEFVAHMAQVNGLPRSAARERTAETLRHVGLSNSCDSRRDYGCWFGDYGTSMSCRRLTVNRKNPAVTATTPTSAAGNSMTRSASSPKLRSSRPWTRPNVYPRTLR